MCDVQPNPDPMCDVQFIPHALVGLNLKVAGVASKERPNPIRIGSKERSNRVRIRCEVQFKSHRLVGFKFKSVRSRVQSEVQSNQGRVLR